MTERGKFIVFEGIDGSGTTCHSQQLANTLDAFGKNVRWTCEPTKSPIGKLLRTYLKGDEELPSWETMTLLFTADRQNHQDNIRKALDNGRWVICDRYAWSTYAYQLAMAKNKNKIILPFYTTTFLEWMESLHDRIIIPDTIYYIDIQVDTALKRIENAGRDIKEVFEYKEILSSVKEMYEFVYEHTETHKELYNSNLLVNKSAKLYFKMGTKKFDNGTQTKEEVANKIWSTTEKIFNL